MPMMLIPIATVVSPTYNKLVELSSGSSAPGNESICLPQPRFLDLQESERLGARIPADPGTLAEGGICIGSLVHRSQN